MLDKLKQFDRTRLILGIIILFTIPCYCLGLILLWNSNLERGQLTPTLSITPDGTKSGSITPTFTFPAVSATITLTPTITTTFTPTRTYVLPPSNTPSPSPSPLPSNTPLPPPTLTDTPVPLPSSTATESPTDTLTPSDTP